MPEDNQWTGRTARQITAAIAGILLPLVLLVAGALLIGYLSRKPESGLSALTMLFAGLTVLISLASIVYSIIALIIANDNIFPGSGDALGMGRALYQSGFLQSQTLLAVFVVGLICMLMSASLVKPSEGLPIITFATGFAFGRQFKPPSNKPPAT